jgi:hypothetical protein
MNSPVRRGYRFELRLGPRPESLDPTTAAASSTVKFAYIAVPETVNRSGVRSFCGDDTGRICYWSDGRTPPTEGGACPSDCPILP